MKNKQIADMIRHMERMMTFCPEINCYDLEQYPLIDEEHFMYMESEFLKDTSYLLVFPYLRNSKKESFVDIYIWDCMRIPDMCKRFVLTFKGQRLMETDERQFLEYMYSDYLRVFQEGFDELCNHIKSVHPEYYYKNYKTEEVGMALLHLYYVSHRSGFQEILYKSGLNYLAYHALDIPDCNYIGSSPAEIVGLPMNLLKILNRPGFERFYTSKDTFEKSKKTYIKYSSYFKKKPSMLQWDYLFRIDNDRLFNKTVYKRLAKHTDRLIVTLYIEFLRLREENKELSIGLPKPKELMDMNDKLSILNHYNNRRINKRIREKKYNTTLEFTGHEYSVRVPGCVNDMGIEAFKQWNCLLDYIKPHSIGDTTIIFIRRTDALDKPFVTAEVSTNRVVIQMLGKYNRQCQSAVYLFMEAYCNYKGISFDPNKLIRESDDYGDNITVSDSISDYMYYYSKRNCYCNRPVEKNEQKKFLSDNRKDIDQISMYDLFPEVMIVEEDSNTETQCPLDDGCIDISYEHTYKNEIDSFIWDNMDKLFDEKNDNFEDCHDKLISMIQSLNINKQSFDLLWDIVEAYNIPEINYAVLCLYRDYLTVDEVQMLMKWLPEDMYQETEERWNRIHI